MNFVPYFDEQIKIQQQAISSFKIWVIALAAVGILVVLGSIFLGRVYAAASSDLIKLGGGFVAILGVFPGKEIFPRKETIAKYSCLKQNFEHYDEMTPDEQKLLAGVAAQLLSK